MQRGKFTGILEKQVMAEKLARRFYKVQGCEAPVEPRDYMEKSTHPQEMGFYQMALIAIDELMKSSEGNKE